MADGGQYRNIRHNVPNNIDLGRAMKIVGIVAAVFLILIVGSRAFYTIGEQEQAVVTTFGTPTCVSEPGLHFKIPFIQQVTMVDTTIKGFTVGYDMDSNVSVADEALMITSDFNFVNVDFYVEYKVSNPIKALYAAEKPVVILKNIAQSHIRSTISAYDVDSVITSGKNEIQVVIRDKIVAELEERDIGLQLVNITIQDAEPPTEAVLEAFKAVETAKQEKETVINNANKYRNGEKPSHHQPQLQLPPLQTPKIKSPEFCGTKNSKIPESPGARSESGTLHVGGACREFCGTINRRTRTMADSTYSYSFVDNKNEDGNRGESQPPRRVRKPHPVRNTLLVLAVLALLAVCDMACVVTNEDEYTLIKRFGKIERVVSESGLTFKIPFIETEIKLDREVLLYDLRESDVITLDKKTMVADSYVLWRIVKPRLYMQTLNSRSEAESRINTIVYNSLKNVISSMNQLDVISGRGGVLDAAIMENIGDALSRYGIELVSVETKHLDLPDDNKNAVYERMISERNNIAATFTAQGASEAKKIRNQTDNEIAIMLSQAEAEAEKTVAAGEAEYMRIISKAYADEKRSDFYTFVRALDAAKVMMQGQDKTLILPPDSPIAQIFGTIE